MLLSIFAVNLNLIFINLIVGYFSGENPITFCLKCVTLEKTR